MSIVASKEFEAGMRNPAESLAKATERMNKWLSQQTDCSVINIETIYGRYGKRQAHFDGEELGIVGLRLWYSSSKASVSMVSPSTTSAN